METSGREIQKDTGGVMAPLRFQPGLHVYVPAGHRLVEHRNRHQLAALLADAVRRGEVEVAGDWKVAKSGAAAVVVKIARQPRSKVPWYIAGITGFIGAMYGIGVLLWQSRYIWLAVLGIAAGVWLAIKLFGGHSAGCTGLHCSGCRG